MCTVVPEAIKYQQVFFYGRRLVAILVNICGVKQGSESSTEVIFEFCICFRYSVLGQAG